MDDATNAGRDRQNAQDAQMKRDADAQMKRDAETRRETDAKTAEAARLKNQADATSAAARQATAAGANDPPAANLGPARDNTLDESGMRMPNSPDKPGDPTRPASNMPNRTPAPVAPVVAHGRLWHVRFHSASVTEAIARVGDPNHPHGTSMPEHARNALSSMLHSLEHDGPVAVDAGHDGVGTHHMTVRHTGAV